MTAGVIRDLNLIWAGDTAITVAPICNFLISHVLPHQVIGHPKVTKSPKMITVGRHLYTNNPYLDRLTGTTAIGRCHHAEIYERAVRGNEDVVLRPLFTLYYCTISNI